MKFIRTLPFLIATLTHAVNIPTFQQSGRHWARDTPSLSVSDPIKTGLVSFGDSYAAGIGAGVTTGDGCRIGEFGYPKLLNTWAASRQPGLDFQNLPCSGAVISDLLPGSKSQVGKWTNPSKADMATISIGGNDVRFFYILNACVLRVWQGLSGDCDEEIEKAYSIMNGVEFSDDLQVVLHWIVAKSGRSDFKLVQTGYPTFFNSETDGCDYTTFYFWQPGHHGFHHGGNWAYLYKPLRVKLNKLVTDLNTKLRSIVDVVNSAYPEPRVFFADPNPAWEGHRFCEEGITEPDPANQGNWLFLASWPDNSLPGTDSALLANISMVAQEATGRQTIPDSATCATTNDWANLTLCGMANAGLVSNSGSDKVAFVQTIELPDSTNISISEINYFMPTNYAKTFHPRSLGHLAYRDLVLNAL